MAKYYGAIGYVALTETSPGIWEEVITEKYYYGDVSKRYRGLNSGSEINDGVTISNDISIIADPYASQNFASMRYITYMGVKWKVSNVEIQYPRLIITTGGVYNEQVVSSDPSGN